ncbi:MAG: hypothetical protein IPI22_11300 [Bacteroidetes bacterium]|nr:hypothetical protein [Bacteroidota bacterium]
MAGHTNFSFTEVCRLTYSTPGVTPVTILAKGAQGANGANGGVNGLAEQAA